MLESVSKFDGEYGDSLGDISRSFVYGSFIVCISAVVQTFRRLEGVKCLIDLLYFRRDDFFNCVSLGIFGFLKCFSLGIFDFIIITGNKSWVLLIKNES